MGFLLNSNFKAGYEYLTNRAELDLLNVKFGMLRT